jgi:hypothetical protein
MDETTVAFYFFLSFFRHLNGNRTSRR